MTSHSPATDGPSPALTRRRPLRVLLVMVLVLALLVALPVGGYTAYRVVAGAPAGQPQAVELRDATISETLTSATVLGVGEATHGTSEFRTTWRLVAQQVADKGFTTIVLEENAGTVAPIDAWAQGGPGTAEDAVRQLGFRLSRTRETVELVTWARAWNEGRPEAERVRFYGIDVQRPSVDRDVAVAWLATHDAAVARQHAEALAPVTTDSAFDNALAAAQLPAAQALRAAVEQAAERSGAPYDDATLRALLSARTLVQGLERGKAGLEAYDRGATLDANLAWLVAERDAVGAEHTLLLFHNGHVDKTARYPMTGTPMLGALAAARWGDAYRTIGTDSRVTRLADSGTTYQFTVHSPIRGLFRGTTIGYLELAQATGENAQVLARQVPMASAGSPFQPVQAWVPFFHEASVVPTQSWDAIVYVTDSHPTTPLP